MAVERFKNQKFGLIWVLSKKMAIFAKMLVFSARLELMIACTVVLCANRYSIGPLTKFCRLQYVRLKTFYITSKKIAWKPRGSLGP